MKTIKYFPKAHEKISARGLSLEDIIQTCLYPEQTSSGKKGRRIAQRKFLNAMNNKQYIVRVIFEEGVDEIKIVTAYKTSKIKKYWKEQP